MASGEFGRAVRRWRDRVPPRTAGLPASGQRRAPGLRREEVAMLAGISADYITRLEQGRAVNPSGQVIEALARALRLSPTERAHLFELAGLAAPGPESVPAHIPPGVHRMLDRLAATPVAVFDAAWTLLLANPPYAALMGISAEPSGDERDANAVWRNLVGAGTRVRHTAESWRMFQSALVADLRTTAARYPADQRLRRLVSDLHAHSARFAELWDAGSIGRHESAPKTIDHPEVGPLTLDCDVLTVAGSDLRIMVYTAEPGTGDAERLSRVNVLGARELVE